MYAPVSGTIKRDGNYKVVIENVKFNGTNLVLPDIKIELIHVNANSGPANDTDVKAGDLLANLRFVGHDVHRPHLHLGVHDSSVPQYRNVQSMLVDGELYGEGENAGYYWNSYKYQGLFMRQLPYELSTP